MKLLVDCKKAAQLCDKCQYENTTFLERARMRLHIWICKPCARYALRNAQLTQLLKDPSCKQMPEACKKRIQEQLKRELANSEYQ